jgi:hypothetical protein
MKAVQLGLNVLLGAGSSGATTLLVATIQFAAPHQLLSSATGLGFSARAIGGAVGSAVEGALVEAFLYPRWTKSVESAVKKAGIPATLVPEFMA